MHGTGERGRGREVTEEEGEREKEGGREEGREEGGREEGRERGRDSYHYRLLNVHFSIGPLVSQVSVYNYEVKVLLHY